MLTENQLILSWSWQSLNELFQLIQEKHHFVNLSVKSGNDYAGVVTAVTADAVYLKELDDFMDLAEFPTAISLKQITTFNINGLPNRVILQRIDQPNKFKQDHDLVKLYLDNPNDDNFKNGPIGLIERSRSGVVLFKEIDQSSGSLENISLIRENSILNIAHDPDELDYYNYLINYHQARGTFDPYGLESVHVPNRLKPEDLVIPKKLVALTDYNQGKIMGLVKSSRKNTVTIQPIDNYYLEDDLKLKWENILAVDFTCGWLKQRKDYILNELINPTR